MDANCNYPIDLAKRNAKCMADEFGPKQCF